jgi:hypothetical protein
MMKENYFVPNSISCWIACCVANFGLQQLYSAKQNMDASCLGMTNLRSKIWLNIYFSAFNYSSVCRADEGSIYSKLHPSVCPLLYAGLYVLNLFLLAINNGQTAQRRQTDTTQLIFPNSFHIFH